MARTSYPSDKQDQFMLRFPDGLRDRLKSAAKDAGRSMNSEIAQRLSQSFDQPAIVGGGGIGAPMLPDGTVMAGVYLVDASIYESKQQEDGSILLTKRATPPVGA